MGLQEVKRINEIMRWRRVMRSVEGLLRLCKYKKGEWNLHGVD